jgi:hypothetical protein
MGGALGSALSTLGGVVLGAAGPFNASGFLPTWALMVNVVIQTRKVEA